MSLSKFNHIKILSNLEISEKIITKEKELFNLKFKKATRQAFKSHKIKEIKRQIAQLKTLLILRLDVLHETNDNTIHTVTKQYNYLTKDF